MFFYCTFITSEASAFGVDVTWPEWWQFNTDVAVGV